MTRDQNYHSPIDEEEAELSPTDGYFGSNNSVPDTILVPDAVHTPATSEGSAKEDEAKGSSFKKNTTYTPATASRHDSDSAYNGSTGGYHDDPNERSPLLEGPPPMYEEAMSSSAQSTSSPAPQQSANVREPVPSFRTSAYGTADSIESMTDHPIDSPSVPSEPLLVRGKSYDEEAAPVVIRSRSKKRSCCGRRKQERSRGSTCRRALSFLLGMALVIWLIVHFATQRRKFEHRFSNPRVQPITNGTNPPPYDDTVQREIRLRKISHSISGTYKLYDLLDLSTVSGSINVNVVPQYGDKPAVLRIGSVSGSVRISIDHTWTQVSQSRVFETYIHTTSGSISGSVIQSGGGNTDVRSKTGGIKLNLLPVNLDDGGNESYISTRELSGSTKIVLESPLDRSRITKLSANYQCSGSGSIAVSHPSEWEGKVHARSVGSGNVKLDGNLEIVQHDRKDVLGRRGNGSELIDIKTLGSGSVKFSC